MVPLTELENLPSDAIPELAVSTPEEARRADLLDALLPEGFYTVVLRKWDFARSNATGAIDPSRVKLVDLEVIEADDQKYVGRHVRFQTIWTTTYTYRGVTTSGLNEFLRGIDDTAEWVAPGDNRQSLMNAASILNDAVANETPIRIKFQWQAFDKDYYGEQGGRDMEKGPEQKALRKGATLRGMANFPQNEVGIPIPEWVGPSGATVEAELSLDRVIPASKRR